MTRPDVTALAAALVDSRPWNNAAEDIIAALAAQHVYLVMPELRAALADVLDDYLATNGPDGYPQPMPHSWHVIGEWLEAHRG